MDRAPVLATPGMDAQSTYVAMSRHREGVQLHYGRDDFAHRNQLARTLSRERVKDMALPKPQPAQGIFSSFRPKALDPAPPGLDNGTGPRAAGANLGQADERYARTLADIDRRRKAGQPALPHQDVALDKARAALDQARPHAARDADPPFSRDPRLISQTASGRSMAVRRAMSLEAEIRSNPQMRADRFVEDWRRLDTQRSTAFTAGHFDQHRRISDRMGVMASSLERDLQMESILRNPTIDLGLGTGRGSGVAHDLMAMVGLGRGSGLGI